MPVSQGLGWWFRLSSLEATLEQQHDEQDRDENHAAAQRRQYHSPVRRQISDTLVVHGLPALAPPRLVSNGAVLISLKGAGLLWQAQHHHRRVPRRAALRGDLAFKHRAALLATLASREPIEIELARSEISPKLRAAYFALLLSVLLSSVIVIARLSLIPIPYK